MHSVRLKQSNLAAQLPGSALLHSVGPKQSEGLKGHLWRLGQLRHRKLRSQPYLSVHVRAHLVRLFVCCCVPYFARHFMFHYQSMPLSMHVHVWLVHQIACHCLPHFCMHVRPHLECQKTRLSRRVPVLDGNQRPRSESPQRLHRWTATLAMHEAGAPPLVIGDLACI